MMPCLVDPSSASLERGARTSAHAISAIAIEDLRSISPSEVLPSLWQGFLESERKSDSTAALKLTSIQIDDGMLTRYLPSDIVDAENYRIGLIPINEANSRGGTTIPFQVDSNSALVLPFTWKELVARVRSVPNQPGLEQVRTLVSIGEVTIDFSRMEACRGGAIVFLTALQFKVLRYFVENPLRVISRDELLNKVWGYNNYPSTRTVDNIMLRLRRSMEPDPANPCHFLTAHGFGYKFIP